MAVETPTPRGAARLHRSCRERMIFGVCGGLAETFDVDPTIVRLAFVLVTLAGGAGLLVYIILAIVLPEVDAPPGERRPYSLFGEPGSERRRQRQHLAAYALIALGLALLASSLEWIPRLHGDVIWPLALVAIGVFILLQRTARS
jgi:phage shock protein PspC (stress-responsive transcriptional regulator)